MIAAWKPLGLQVPTVVAVCGSTTTASVLVLLKSVAFSRLSFQK